MDPGIEFAPAAAKEFYERSRSIWLRAINEQPETWRRMVALGGESIANTEGLMRMDRVGVQNFLLMSDGISDDEIVRMQGSDSTEQRAISQGHLSREMSELRRAISSTQGALVRDGVPIGIRVLAQLDKEAGTRYSVELAGAVVAFAAAVIVADDEGTVAEQIALAALTQHIANHIEEHGISTDAEKDVRVVPDIDTAIEHIRQYGTGHTEAIVTGDIGASERFVSAIDTAVVAVNSSTRFTDGEEFGFGAEIGNSTQKLHVRGPMGLESLTSERYVLYGDGQVR